MVVNQNHVQALMGQIDDDAAPATLREQAATYEDYVSRGKTAPAPGSGENISIDSLAEAARILRERADAFERGDVKDMEEAWTRGIGPAPTNQGPPAGRHHEPSQSP